MNVWRLEAITCGVNRLCICFQNLALLLRELIAQRDWIWSALDWEHCLLKMFVLIFLEATFFVYFVCYAISTILPYAIMVHFAMYTNVPLLMILCTCVLLLQVFHQSCPSGFNQWGSLEGYDQEIWLQSWPASVLAAICCHLCRWVVRANTPGVVG